MCFFFIPGRALPPPSSILLCQFCLFRVMFSYFFWFSLNICDLSLILCFICVSPGKKIFPLFFSVFFVAPLSLFSTIFYRVLFCFVALFFVLESDASLVCFTFCPPSLSSVHFVSFTGRVSSDMPTKIQ